MAKMVFKPWEKGLTNIRLVPKLVLLMVFSTVLLIGKQLWDANTFYQSVVNIQQDRSQELAEANAAMLTTFLAQGEAGKVLAEQAIAAQSSSWDQGAYLYLVERDNGKLLGHPQARSINELTAVMENGNSLSGFLNQFSGAGSLVLNNQERFEYAVELPQWNWLVVASQSASEAEAYYNDYLVQVAWQTALMIVSFVVILLGGSSTMLRQTRYLADNIQLL
ncbi:methyl-accepting chemotaxis protein, partial [Photobacterium sp. OFAV2-7]|nr:methyl-accepting chemotaxis protein [Photobacterium sp. OFAV2-7]